MSYRSTYIRREAIVWRTLDAIKNAGPEGIPSAALCAAVDRPPSVVKQLIYRLRKAGYQIDSKRHATNVYVMTEQRQRPAMNEDVILQTLQAAAPKPVRGQTLVALLSYDRVRKALVRLRKSRPIYSYGTQQGALYWLHRADYEAWLKARDDAARAERERREAEASARREAARAEIAAAQMAARMAQLAARPAKPEPPPKQAKPPKLPKPQKHQVLTVKPAKPVPARYVPGPVIVPAGLVPTVCRPYEDNRYKVDRAESIFAGLRPGQYLPAETWAARVYA